MTITKSQPCIELVRRSDKEERLVQFIGSYVRAVRDGEVDDPRQQQLTCVAKSLHSPVMRALERVADEIAAAKLDLHAIITEPRAAEAPSGTLDALLHSVRIATDPRLLDAHEQLTLGGTHTWIGDSMRRDADKRDAFERFETACAETNKRGRACFDRFWGICEPVVLVSSTTEHQGAEEQSAPAGSCSVVAQDGRESALVSTRH